MSTHPAPATATLLPPHGLDDIIAIFGDIFAFIRPDHTLDPRWQPDFLDRVALRFSLPLSWDRSRSVSQFSCHRLLIPVFLSVFAEIQSAGLQTKLTSFGVASHFVRSARERSSQLTPGELRLI